MNRMIRAAVAAAVLAAAVPAAAAAETPGGVLAAEAEWYAALSEASRPRMDALIADDFAYQHPTGATYGKAEFVELFASRTVTVDTVGAADRTVRDHGPVAVVYGSNPIGGVLAGTPYAGTMRFVNVWRNDGGTWRLVHRNSELLP
jgi:ketosteroid isomerase-like protein